MKLQQTLEAEMDEALGAEKIFQILKTEIANNHAISDSALIACSEITCEKCG